MTKLLRTASYIWHYFFASFLAPDRLKQYEELIRSAVQTGYVIFTVEQFAAHVHANRPLPALTLILRNDVDTDPGTARAMFNIGRLYDIRSSYYFRLSTLDFPLMEEMAAFGCEVSYHFEEIATYAKRTGSRSATELINSIEVIRDHFRHNLGWLRARTGLKMRVVAAHGDFANRVLKLPSTVLLDDKALRRELDILAEAYDPDLAQSVDVSISDEMPPVYWRKVDALQAVQDRTAAIALLVHPRQWRTNVMVNLLDVSRRAAEGLGFALRRRLSRIAAHYPAFPGLHWLD